MRSMAFDAKEFRVRNVVGHEFYTPLGVGVKFNGSDEEIKNQYGELIQKYKKSFESYTNRLIYSFRDLIEEFTMKRAIPFADHIIDEITPFIDYVHVSYVILPPKKVNFVTVGGVYAPVKEIKTEDFLRNLSPMFSYLTAWTALPKYDESTKYLIDSFSSKSTRAWDDLVMRVGTNMKIYSHGDECNPLISIADLIAFLTDIKLKNQKLHLKPENIEKVWDGYFPVNVRFLDDKVLNKYVWYNDNKINFSNYLAHPMVFILVDRIKEYFKGVVHINEEEKEIKFSKILPKTDVYINAATYAFMLNGSFQLFDPYIDTDKIKNGDIMVYVGEKSKKIAKTYQDMYDIKVIKGKELNRKIKSGI